MVKVVVKGAGGRMGGQIVSLILSDKNFKLAGAVEAKGHPSIGHFVGEFSGAGKKKIKISERLPSLLGDQKTVCIDFTSPESTIESFHWAQKNKVPLVIGTTGYSNDQLKLFSKVTEVIPVVYSPNMSIGVNMMFRIIEEIASKLGRLYDMEIVELHHRLKKDAPSGTALKMAQILSKAIGENLDEVAVYHRKGLIGERRKGEIGIQSIRGGDIVGEHTVYFAGPGERLEITHRATSRNNFARGALMAASWVVGKEPGLYSMQDVLGI